MQYALVTSVAPLQSPTPHTPHSIPNQRCREKSAITIRTLQKMNSFIKIIAIGGLTSNNRIAQATEY
ncbi:MAG: hypothetical protein HC862_17095 [Scytonema sp. RU_4_4]|nr:hypothetical protein [Scytonema sp. RU_4_4]NJR72851.1 hypothetical protein [Scytonema sp. CRU_2_7]